MKVILLDDIPKLGRRGEVRDVAEGYARNYLLPHRLVLPASPQNLKQIEQIKQHQEVRSQRAKAEAEEVAKRIETLSIAEARQASEEGRLYGSVGVSDVAAFLAKNGISGGKSGSRPSRSRSRPWGSTRCRSASTTR